MEPSLGVPPTFETRYIFPLPAPLLIDATHGLIIILSPSSSPKPITYLINEIDESYPINIRFPISLPGESNESRCVHTWKAFNLPNSTAAFSLIKYNLPTFFFALHFGTIVTTSTNLKFTQIRYYKGNIDVQEILPLMGENIEMKINKLGHQNRNAIFIAYHSQLQMKMKMVMRNNPFKGTTLTALSFKNIFLLLQPASRIQTILAPFHSDSASNHHRPPSVFDKITKLDDALQLFDQMTQTQPLPSVVKFTQLLQAVTKMQHYSYAIHLFKEMAAIRAPVNVYTTTIVIKCCCQMSCTREAFAIVAYGFRRGVVPNVITFSTLLNGLILEDRILEAERLFKKLIKMKLCEPNVVMYSTMIKGLCKVGINDTAIALLRLMDERGCKPNVITYNTIIDSLCKDEMVDDAFKLFNEMILLKGILPDVVTYSSLIRGLCNSGRWDDASKMLREMEDERISPNVVTYTILVDALCKEGMVEDAKAVMNIMEERGKLPNLLTYNSLIDGYCLRGEMNKAREIFDLMKIRGNVPNIITYNSLLNGCCKKSEIDDALHLFHQITEKGMKPDAITYNTLLQGLFRVGRCKDALELFNEMRTHNHVPPTAFTYGIVLEGLCNNHQLDEALSLFRLMGENKLDLDIVAYNILIDGASKCGKLDIAKALFNELSNIGLHPDVRTCTVMIRCFFQKGLVREAKELFQKMEEIGCVPDQVTYNVLLQGLLKNGQHDTIKMLLEEMEGKGLSVVSSSTDVVLRFWKVMFAMAAVVIFATAMVLGGNAEPAASRICSFYSNSASKHRRSSVFDKITKLDDALQLFDQMTQRKPLPSVVKFTHLLQAVAKMKHYSSAINLFKQMTAIGLPVYKYTVNVVIKCCCQMSCTIQGFAIVGYGFKRGVVPNVITFNTLLNGFILEDRILEAERLFKQLIKGKLCEPDVVMCNTMIKGLCKFGINDTAIALLRLMGERGCKPDVITYSTIIDSLCKDEMIADALKLFNEMILHKRILPTVVTYNSLVHGLCNLGRWGDAFKMLREMKDGKISPNVRTYNILVHALCKEGTVEDAETFLNIMVERGKDPILVIFNSLVDGYYLQGDMRKAKKIFYLMKVRGHVPDDVTYNSFLKGYCKKLKIDEALHLFYEITEKGMKPDVVTYNTMLQGLFRVGRCKDALELFNEMRTHNHVPPTALTYGIVLEGLCNNHQLDEALSQFRLMDENKLDLSYCFV
ncbi:hypothetical protein OSB04_011602 [Centaurea solstitialis]|uniref:Pentatricopeptide repeat-containing protein n=1 Tax=Centaurea solstitialis TaxID=347529 RepID=A0AA38TUH2_9ASTR|nr:hypothetical protein OSB04_011602 [Centaurea solstitialis]